MKTMLTLTALLSLTIGSQAAMSSTIVKSDVDRTDVYTTCGATDTASATVYVGPCQHNNASAFDTYGHLEISPLGLGHADERSFGDGEGQGVTVVAANGPIGGEGRMVETTDFCYAYATSGAFLGEVTALADANTDKQGGFVGASFYIATKGSITGVATNLFKGGPTDDGKEGYFDVPLAKTSSYTSGDFKMNIYGWANEQTQIGNYFGFRYHLKYVAGTADELKEPVFTVGGNQTTLATGESLDNIEQIQFTTKACLEAQKDCLTVDLSDLDAKYGLIPSGCAWVEADNATKTRVLASDADKAVILPASCFPADESNTGQLQVNVFRKAASEFYVDFTFDTADFRAMNATGRGNYVVFDPKYEVDTAVVDPDTLSVTDTDDTTADGGDTDDTTADGGDTDDTTADGGDTDDTTADGGDTDDGTTTPALNAGDTTTAALGTATSIALVTLFLG